VLRGAPRRAVAVVNALRQEDLEVAALALLRAEKAGRNLVYRTAASFVQARAGISHRPLLAREEIGLGPSTPGLVIVGSYVQRTSEQLSRLLAEPRVAGVEVGVKDLLEGDPQAEITRVARATDTHLAAGRTPVVYTSREYLPGADRALARGQRISEALIRILTALRESPAFIVAKGGITSHVLAAQGLGVVSATVLGQIAPGVSVWKPRRQARPPFVPYIVFPGNVGGPDALAAVVAQLQGPRV